MFVHIILSSVWAAGWPPLEKELLTGLSISMFSLFFFIFSPVSLLFSSSFPIHITPNLDPIIFAPSVHIYSPTTIIFLKDVSCCQMRCGTSGIAVSRSVTPHTIPWSDQHVSMLPHFGTHTCIRQTVATVLTRSIVTQHTILATTAQTGSLECYSNG